MVQRAPSARKPWLPQPRLLRSLPTVCPVRSQTIDCPINGCKSNRGVARWWDTACVAWMVAMPPGRRRLLAPGSAEAVAEREKASVRARVEHPFRVIKRQFGHMEARYRGLAKNGSHLVARFAPGDTVRAWQTSGWHGAPCWQSRLPPARVRNPCNDGGPGRRPKPCSRPEPSLAHAPRATLPGHLPRTGRESCLVRLFPKRLDRSLFCRRECPRGGDGDGSESERREACPRTPKEVSCFAGVHEVVWHGRARDG